MFKSFRFSDEDHGAAKLIRQVGEAKRNVVDVGVLGSKADRPEEGGLTVGDVAAFAEFGIGQPRRSWCAGWVDENEQVVRALSKRGLAAIANGMPTEQALQTIGLAIAAKMQERISSGIQPANAPSTVRAKGSSTPLVDSGQFRSSISPRVVAK